ncbi:hypothetical protein HYH03_013318 [Edaphochlamys debaryana]|uniref:Proline dehydrogenase n=1 Tax=Edaphochlamys debaryana TaxID=47281 RepID=A0A835XQE2_9CHLO|nr:hypothetical protein HYH03_013318 [Edaphochlamys debaryana]|eukprot:KAG2488176.1 hypothetical protein HYH03_013318 [Edaphochlamys debaryana]
MRSAVPAGLRTARAVRGPVPLSVFKTYGFSSHETEPKADLTFTDHAAIFEGRSTADLLRALVVLRLCAVQPLASNSEALLEAARRRLGDERALGFVKDTFYGHFIAGKEPADVWGRMNALRANGIGAILDWAEEEDLLHHCTPSATAAATTPAASAAPAAAGSGSTRPRVSAREPLGGETLVQSRVAARTYEYQSEDACDRHAAAFAAAIDTAANLPGQGFAAIKLSALGDPTLLQHLADAVRSVRALFEAYDLNSDGSVSADEFAAVYEKLAAAAGITATDDERRRLWAWLDPRAQGSIDLISWTHRMDLRRLPDMAASMQAQAPAVPGAPSPQRPWELSTDEQRQLEALFGRLEGLVARAIRKGVKLMIDAEQSSLRPAIDLIGQQLMREYNCANPAEGEPAEARVFITYQAYLRDAEQRLQDDLARAQREGYVLGAKLVRGAYLHLERRAAAEAGLPPPVWDRIEDTHACFERSLDSLLCAAKEGRAELMLGSHNKASVEQAVAAMSRLGLDPAEAPVYFGQLLGMADSLTFTLGRHGYRVFKYTPYGSVDKVIPYLLRRVNENQYITAGGKQDVALLWAELWRRALHASPLGGLMGAGGSGGGSARASAT